MHVHVTTMSLGSPRGESKSEERRQGYQDEKIEIDPAKSKKFYLKPHKTQNDLVLSKETR